MARKQRLDLQLVERGLAVSRQQAQQLIRAGKVRSGDRVLDKPGLELAPDADLQVEQPPRFVSRGGEKLLGALAVFPLALEGRVVCSWLAAGWCRLGDGSSVTRVWLWCWCSQRDSVPGACVDQV